MTHVRGWWTETELPQHINALEFHAACLTFQAFGAPHIDVHIRPMLDNTTASTYINKMGGGGIHAKTFGTGLHTGISGYQQHMSPVRTTRLPILNRTIFMMTLSEVYPPIRLQKFRNSSISPR